MDFLFAGPNVLPLPPPLAGFKDVLAGAFETIAGIDGVDVTVLSLDPSPLSVPTPVLVTFVAGVVVVPLMQSAAVALTLLLALEAATFDAAIFDILLLALLVLLLLLPLVAAAAAGTAEAEILVWLFSINFFIVILLLLLLLAVFLKLASVLPLLMALVVKSLLLTTPFFVAFLDNFFTV